MPLLKHSMETSLSWQRSPCGDPQSISDWGSCAFLRSGVDYGRSQNVANACPRQCATYSETEPSYGKRHRPRPGTGICDICISIIAIVFVAIGELDFIAQILTMFFMVTYGALCAVSFLEHFASNPSYRPTFHSRWYLSLLGTVMCGLMMFQISVLYAFYLNWTHGGDLSRSPEKPQGTTRLDSDLPGNDVSVNSMAANYLTEKPCHYV